MSAITIHGDMRAASRALVLAIAGLPDQQWEGRDYSPTKGTPYVSESFRPIASDVRATGVGGTIAHSMNSSFTLHYPSNAGTLAIEAMAGAIMEAFRPGTALSYSTSSGVVLKAERGPLLQEPDWINCSITINIVAYTSN